MLKLGALVRFCLLWGSSGHGFRTAKCPLMTQSGHCGSFLACMIQISVWKLKSRLSQYPQQRDRRFRN